MMSDGQADNMSVVDYLIAVMVVVFVLQFIIPGFTEAFYFHPALALVQPWRFLTAIFLHGGLMHLFFNAYALYLFGKLVESKIGSREFIKIFFISGIAGNLLYYATYVFGLTVSPALGASGAIYGIMGVAALLFPDMRIMMFPIFIPISMRTAVIAWIVLSFLGIFDVSSGIASAAHLGGLIVGLIYGKKLKDEIVKEYYWWME